MLRPWCAATGLAGSFTCFTSHISLVAGSSGGYRTEYRAYSYHSGKVDSCRVAPDFSRKGAGQRAPDAWLASPRPDESMPRSHGELGRAACSTRYPATPVGVFALSSSAYPVRVQGQFSAQVTMAPALSITEAIVLTFRRRACTLAAAARPHPAVTINGGARIMFNFSRSRVSWETDFWAELICDRCFG